MEKNLKYCPKCQNELIKLGSGKLVCRSCSWSDKSSSNKPTNEINFSDKITMRGIILTYDNKLKKGLISGNDGRRYELVEKEWNLLTKPQAGLHIDFEVTNGRAYNILLIPQRNWTLNTPVFPRLIILCAGLFLLISGMNDVSTRGASEGVFSSSLIAEQVRSQGRIEIGLGIALIGFSFVLNANIKTN